jgi:hypothetical protein
MEQAEGLNSSSLVQRLVTMLPFPKNGPLLSGRFLFDKTLQSERKYLEYPIKTKE